jgi:hypothetical protein
MPSPLFSRYIGIGYSGAETASSSLKGLRVYMAGEGTAPEPAAPPPGKWCWSRRGIAEWLEARLTEDTSALVGIDRGFTFPPPYSGKYGLPRNWTAFFEDFSRHWPAGGDRVYVDFVRYGLSGNGAARTGDSRWRRLTEVRSGAAKSVFYFDVPGSAAKSTHAGLPWLLYLKRSLGDRGHFWPFDSGLLEGTKAPAGPSAIVEAYPSLRNKPHAGRTEGSGDRRPDSQLKAVDV